MTDWQNRITRYGEQAADQFLANPLNPRRHPQPQRDAVKGSLDTLGWIAPVIVNKRTGYMIDGHERVMQALGQGDDTPVPFIEVDLSEDEERLALASFDWITQMAVYDRDSLDTLLQQVNTDDAALQSLLSELAESQGIVSFDETPQESPEAQIDRAEELQQKWQVQRGDVWVIGKHRIMCGDSTSTEDVARLMGAAKLRLIFSSPPYADQRTYQIGDFDWHALMCGVFSAITPHCDNPSDILINLGMSHVNGRVNRYYDAWLDFCEQQGFPLYGWYIWDKGSGFPGEWNGRLAPSHEFVFHFSVGHVSAEKWIETSGESKKRGVSGKRFRQRDGSLKELTSPDTVGQAYKIPDSVIRITREMARGIHTEAHPAVFPAEFASFIINTWSINDDTVLDPFLGSGTTIVACQQTGRIGYGMELAEKYVAVALERLSQMGLTPQLETQE